MYINLSFHEIEREREYQTGQTVDHVGAMDLLPTQKLSRIVVSSVPSLSLACILQNSRFGTFFHSLLSNAHHLIINRVSTFFERCLLVPVKLFFFHHSCRELSRTFLHVCQKPKISILSIRTATAMNRSQLLPRLGHGVYVSASSAFSMSDHVQSDTKDLSVGHLSESVAWGRRRMR